MIRILIPLDGSQLAEQALSHAVAIAQSFRTEIHLLQVVTEAEAAVDVVAASSDMRLRMAEAASYLHELADRVRSGRLNVETAVRNGRAAENIIGYAKDAEVDLISLTAYGLGGVTEFVTGSTVHKVISRAGTSILMVRPDSNAQDMIKYRKLLVPLDGSYQSDWALCLATSIARAHAAELVLMQIIETPKCSTRLPASAAERELVQRLMEIHRSEAAHHLRELETQLPKGLAFSSHVVVAEEAARVIEETAQTQNVGLVVLSAHSVAQSDCWLYGPVPETLLAHGTRPLLVLRDDFSAERIEFEPQAEPLAVNE